MKLAAAPPKTVPDIIGLWPSASVFARDLGLRRESHATVMKARRSIPPQYWGRVLTAAGTRKIDGLSLELLVKIHKTEAALRSDKREIA